MCQIAVCDLLVWRTSGQKETISWLYHQNLRVVFLPSPNPPVFSLGSMVFPRRFSVFFVFTGAAPSSHLSSSFNMDPKNFRNSTWEPQPEAWKNRLNKKKYKKKSPQSRLFFKAKNIFNIYIYIYLGKKKKNGLSGTTPGHVHRWRHHACQLQGAQGDRPGAQRQDAEVFGGNEKDRGQSQAWATVGQSG